MIDKPHRSELLTQYWRYRYIAFIIIRREPVCTEVGLCHIQTSALSPFAWRNPRRFSQFKAARAS